MQLAPGLMGLANEKAQISNEAVGAAVSAGDRIRFHIPRAQARPRAMAALHWLTVLFLVLAAGVVLVRSVVDGRHLRDGLLELHRHLGLCVLLLFALRIALRLRLGRLPAPGRSAWPMRAAAVLTHAALYASIGVLPLLGWMLSDAQGKPVRFLGLALPHLAQPDFDLADQLLVWHQDAAWALLALTLLHLAATLWHHFVLHDAVLRAMWPGRGR
jgi:cytochrome b561